MGWFEFAQTYSKAPTTYGQGFAVCFTVKHFSRATDFEIGWIVGIIDGEGSFILMKRKDGRRVPRITIPSTDIEILQRCKEILGGYFCKRADKRKNVRQAYVYVLQGQSVLDFATTYWDRFSQPVKRARARHLQNYHLALTKAKIANFEREFYQIAADYGYQTRVQL